MNNIKKLEISIDKVNGFISEAKRELLNNPDSETIKISLRSWEYELRNLRAALVKEREERFVEVIEARLIGSGMDGSISLTLLSKISDFLSRSILISSNKIMHGRDSNRISKPVESKIDLRLGGLVPGSTRLFITGNSQPDMYGYSPLGAVLTNLFAVLQNRRDILESRYLNVRDADEFISNLGVTGSKSLLELLGLLLKGRIELDLKWVDDYNEEHIWHGTSNELHRTYQTLSSSQIDPPEIVELSGKVRRLSDGEKLTSIIIELASGKKIYIKIPPENFFHIGSISLRDNITVQCEKQTVFSSHTNTFRDYYHLIELIK